MRLKSSGLKDLRHTRHAPARLGGLPGSGLGAAGGGVGAGVGSTGTAVAASESGIIDGRGVIFVT